ncbi:hypothetical protein ACLB2K_038142 [Fragaria x ananassa]
MSIVAYYTKLKGLWDELASFNSFVTCNCGAQNDRTKLMQFLIGLNESYSGTRGQILLMNLLPSVRQAYAYVAQEEMHRELAFFITMPSNTAAMIVRGNNNNNNNMSALYTAILVTLAHTQICITAYRCRWLTFTIVVAITQLQSSTPHELARSLATRILCGAS